jgi:3D (Asp-Asp-Asp) domain-containing protein
LLAFALGCGPPARSPTGPPAPAPAGPYTLTYYWVASETEAGGARETDLRDPLCRVLEVVPAAFARNLAIEGTGRLADGRLVNVSEPCLCGWPCYVVLDARYPFGLGTGGRALVPFRSVAVDPKVVPIGEPLYLRELDDERMPGNSPWGGFVHDGCVVADDVGGAILSRHVDLFVAERAAYRTLDRAFGRKTITVEPAEGRCPPR